MQEISTCEVLFQECVSWRASSFFLFSKQLSFLKQPSFSLIFPIIIWYKSLRSIWEFKFFLALSILQHSLFEIQSLHSSSQKGAACCLDWGSKEKSISLSQKWWTDGEQSEDADADSNNFNNAFGQSVRGNQQVPVQEPRPGLVHLQVPQRETKMWAKHQSLPSKIQREPEYWRIFGLVESN